MDLRFFSLEIILFNATLNLDASDRYIVRDWPLGLDPTVVVSLKSKV
jgi:hypothetical protein